jgi:hypothetical protein
MSIITPNQLRQYFISKDIPVDKITPLTGGTANFVFRITSLSGQSRIIKHSEPFCAVAPDVPFSVERLDFEVHALRTIPKLVPQDETVQLPALLRYDEEYYVLDLEDMGDTTFKAAYLDLKLDVCAVGQKIGRWFARLHASTRTDEVKRGFDNQTAKAMYRYVYNNLAPTLERHGYDPFLGERINAKYGALLQTDDDCVCHGDIWPANILLFPRKSHGALSEELGIAVIDWEMTRSGNGATDIAQFAAESWLLDRYRGGRGLLRAFLEGYVKERPLGENDRERVAVHFGSHLVFWPTIYVSRHILSKISGLGVLCRAIIRRAEANTSLNSTEEMD